ncbi:MAG: DUF438 domain-containing protein [Ruminococcaceae bacterium]|nr:DUF438 domain-containing protein [Oscillospiraceae bacterium]
MRKKLDLSKTVSELVAENPELKDILVELGFKDITQPLALSTVGRIMTIPNGASIKGIELAKVITALQANGFEIDSPQTGAALDKLQPAAGTDAKAAAKATAKSTGDKAATETPEGRAQLLKKYITRLSDGEDLEAVRADFVENFSTVDAAEIARAEQDLIQDGMPIAEVQRLCDIHSALFHGATREEQIANADKAVMDSLKNRENESDATALDFSKIPGHPVNVFMAENENFSHLLEDVKKALAEQLEVPEIIKRVNALRAVTVHYARKGDLIYPLLNKTYGFSGPSNVMWGVDDEIRDELKVLAGAGNTLPDFAQRLENVLVRAEEMIYKENNILYPLCIQKFSEEDWMRIYYEIPAYATTLTEGYPVWQAAEEKRAELKTVAGKTAAEALIASAEGQVTSAGDAVAGYVTLGSGMMTLQQIEAVLNTVPMELTFVDEENINRFFSPGEKLFKRPDMAIGREVFSCHPPKVEAMVRRIIDDFRAGKGDSVKVWGNKGGVPVYVQYLAVRDSDGKYVGTLECVQDMTFAEEHFNK